MKVPIRSLLLFNLDLSGIFFFFFNYYGTKDICCGGGREEFSNEQNIPKTGSGRGGFRIARTVGDKRQTSATFIRVSVVPPWRLLHDKQETVLNSVMCWDSRDITTTHSPALYGSADGPELLHICLPWHIFQDWICLMAISTINVQF